jgi:hypothetical protein
MNTLRWLTLFQYAAGLCDAATGLLLVFAPAFTLRLMHVTTAPQPIDFIGYIGAFVLSVGLSYLWIAVRSPLSAQTCLAWITQWQITALIRSIVALFLIAETAAHRLEPAWVLVALTDGSLAVVQWIGLSRGWLARAD